MLNYFDYSNSFISESDLEKMYPSILSAHRLLNSKEGPGAEFLGWLDYPNTINQLELKKIKQAASKIQDNSEILVVIGIGGSYLGSKAVISALTHSFYNEIPQEERKTPKIYFAGQNISPTYLNHLLEIIGEQNISLNIISKSGTTTESAIAFRFFKKFLYEKYGNEEACNRIYVTTDKKEGALKMMAEQEGYTSFVIPSDIGGRYSVFTPVGLLPIACAGVDIDNLLDGAREGIRVFNEENLDNPCYQYAATRNILCNMGKEIEILTNYEPQLSYISEWWKQLFGESEGKDGKGLFPASVNFSTDLHSLGQIIQDGKKNMFETTINIEQVEADLQIPLDYKNLDNLNYIAGKTMNYVNSQAFRGTLYAHIDGKVPNMIINLPEISAFSIGKLLYFFQKSCAISGYILGVNPFNQPGVESYKKNMFGLLSKPGYEHIGEQLNKMQKFD